ncbi:MAG TPA: GNAT family N-acetyltransferase [Burkholderiales bacterium]|nr:GNAT family N-acetyltransferase [Burkholderiales bacterium]
MDRRLAIRELRQADAEAVQAFVRRLSPESRRRRFFAPIAELVPRQLASVTCGNGPDDVNLGVFDAAGCIVGLAQYAVEQDAGAEFAVVVDDALQRSGLGARLVGLLIERARERGLGGLHGLVQNDNWPMLGLAAKLGFELLGDPDPRLLRVERSLAEAHAI